MQVLPTQFDPAKEHHLLIVLHGHGSDRWQYIREARGECRAARDVAARFSLILVSPDYRAKTSWMGPQAEADVLQVIRELKTKYRIGKVIVSGASMGGASALTFAGLHPELSDGVVALNGTANLLEYDNFQPAIEASFGGSKAQIPEEYKRRSAEYWPEKLTMPIALTAGGQDTVVPPVSIVRMAKILKTLQRPVLLLMQDSGGHSTSYEESVAAYEYTIQKVLSRSDSPRSGVSDGYTRIREVTYTCVDGTNLTMDIFKSDQPNGLGVIDVVSGGWTSTTNMMSMGFIQAFLTHGYTVFAAMHGSQPRYKLPEILSQVQTAVRFVRAHAAEYHIDPARLGIYGSSSGGHLTLMAATCGKDGSPDAADASQRVSSQLQAAACFCPPTDFSNYGQPGVNAFRAQLKGVRSGVGGAAVESEQGLDDFAREFSPCSRLTKDMPPVLIIHGDKDPLVPLQQATRFIEQCQKLGVPAQLIIRPGEQHAMSTWVPDHAVLAAWFDENLLKHP